ncbi:MAG: class I SAM-dependent methyltransferase, partial [Ruminococcus sp.]|nr:class I SAM-dependent methyltransferase [Ruminococcus sp.]
MKTLQEYLKQATEGYAVRLTADQLKQFDTYYRLLVEWNQRINLTAITDPEGVAVKHFADSLSFFNYCTIPEGGAV